MKKISSFHVKPQTGIAFKLNKNEVLRIIDPKGEQVADLMAFSLKDKEEYLSSGRTIDYNNKIYFTKGDVLYSNKSSPMLAITEDKVGKHDFLLTPCSQEMFRIIYKVKGHHPSCFENLAANLNKFGIRESQISVTFNVFMNVDISPSGEIKVKPPLSKAGDYIDLKAKMGLIVGITACSAGMSNNYSFKPIDVEVYK